jgi:hypothetical protein
MNTLTCNLPQCTFINTLQPLNGSIVHQCTSNHKFSPEWLPLASMPPYTLRMHSTNSNQVFSFHTQNLLNQLKSSAFLTHSECTQPTQIKCSPYTLRMHSNQDLQCWNVHTCTSNASKYLQRAPIQHLYTSKLEMAFKTSKLLQSSSKLLQGSKSASKNPLELKLAPPTNTKPQDLS